MMMTNREPSERTLRDSDCGQQLARLVLSVFLLAFIVTRVTVYLIMSRRIPDLYLHVRQTHVHHLNYGIFMLSGVGAVLLFLQPQGRALRTCAVLYAIGLALTFDEFGMWLHLGGPYSQRASSDAVVVIATVLALVASAATVKRFTPRHRLASALIIVSLVVFAVTWKDSLRHSEERLRLRLEVLEQTAPP